MQSSSYADADPTQFTAELPNVPSTSKRKYHLSSSSQLGEKGKGNTDGSTTETDTDDDDKRLLTQNAPDAIEPRIRDIDQNEYQSPTATKKIKYSSPEETSMNQNGSSVNTQSAPTSGHSNRKVGIRQPMKRGGKRF